MNVMYMGELAVCKVLWDKQGNISALKQVAKKIPAEIEKSYYWFLYV
jgi:hypothetical protein